MANDLEILKDYYNLSENEQSKINKDDFPILKDFYNLPENEQDKILNDLGIVKKKSQSTRDVIREQNNLTRESEDVTSGLQVGELKSTEVPNTYISDNVINPINSNNIGTKLAESEKSRLEREELKEPQKKEELTYKPLTPYITKNEVTPEQYISELKTKKADAQALVDRVDNAKKFLETNQLEQGIMPGQEDVLLKQASESRNLLNGNETWNEYDKAKEQISEYNKSIKQSEEYKNDKKKFDDFMLQEKAKEAIENPSLAYDAYTDKLKKEIDPNNVYSGYTGIKILENFEFNKDIYAKEYLNVGLLTNFGIKDINYKLYEAKEKINKAIKEGESEQNIASLESNYNHLLSQKYSATNISIEKLKQKRAEEEDAEKITEIDAKIKELEALKGDVFDDKNQYRIFENVLDGNMKQSYDDGIIPKDATALDAIKIYFSILQRELQDYNYYYSEEDNSSIFSSKSLREGLPIISATSMDNRYNQIVTELKSLAPVVLLNKNNLDKNSFLLRGISSWYGGIVESKDAVKTVFNLPSSQEDIARNIEKAINITGIDEKNVGEGQKELIKKESDTTFGEALTETVGVSTAMGMGMMVGTGLVNYAGKAVNSAMALNTANNVAKGNKFLNYLNATNKLTKTDRFIGEIVKTGLEYETTGQIFNQNKDELNFLSGMMGGAAGKLTEDALSFGFFKLFKDEAPTVITKMANLFGRGTAETTEEFAQEFTQTWQGTETYEDFKTEIKQKFGNFSDVGEFALMTFMMGAIMGGGNIVGNKSEETFNLFYDKLSDEEKVRVDNAVEELSNEVSNDREEDVKDTLGVNDMTDDDIKAKVEENKVILNSETDKSVIAKAQIENDVYETELMKRSQNQEVKTGLEDITVEDEATIQAEINQIESILSEENVSIAEGKGKTLNDRKQLENRLQELKNKLPQEQTQKQETKAERLTDDNITGQTKTDTDKGNIEDNGQSNENGLSETANKMISLYDNGVDFSLFDKNKLVEIAEENNVELDGNENNNEIIKKIKNKQNANQEQTKTDTKQGNAETEQQVEPEVSTGLEDILSEEQQVETGLEDILQEETPTTEQESTQSNKKETFADNLDNVEDIGDVMEGGKKVNIGGADVIFTENADEVVVESIEVPKATRGKGVAKKAMNQITKLADDKGKQLTLKLKPKDETVEKERLQSFYEGLGFEMQEDGVTMIRPSKKLETSTPKKSKNPKKIKNSGANKEYRRKRKVVTEWEPSSPLEFIQHQILNGARLSAKYIKDRLGYGAKDNKHLIGLVKGTGDKKTTVEHWYESMPEGLRNTITEAEFENLLLDEISKFQGRKPLVEDMYEQRMRTENPFYDYTEEDYKAMEESAETKEINEDVWNTLTDEEKSLISQEEFRKLQAEELAMQDPEYIKSINNEKVESRKKQLQEEFDEEVEGISETEERKSVEEGQLEENIPFQEESKEQKISKTVLQKLVDKLKKAFPNVKVNLFSDKEISKKLDEIGVSEEVQKQIIGKQGAKNLDKQEEATYRIDNLGIAKEMEQAGGTPKEIRLATGWERGADKKWRYEISDFSLVSRFSNNQNQKTKNSFRVLGKGYSIKLKDLISNGLLELYPSFANYEVRLGYTGNSQGSFGGNTITLSEQRYRDVINEIQRALNKSGEFGGAYVLNDPYLSNKLSEIESVLLHEIQHAIQDIEGFAKGGNIRVAKKEIVKSTFNKIYKLYNDGKTIEDIEDITGYDYENIASILDKIDEVGTSKFENSIDVENGLTAYEVYKRLAGEVESRNVETRKDFTEQQRRETLLQETEDVAREDQIFLQNNLGEANSDNRFSKEEQIRYQKELSEKGITLTPNGFVYKGEVYLNTDKAKLDTPIHEFGHIWNQFAKKNYRRIFERGLQLVKGSEYEKQVRSNPAYSHLSNEEILEEALAQAIGEKGAKFIKAKENAFKQFIVDLFSKIRNALGIRSMSSEQLMDLTLEDYTDLVAGELLAEKEISGESFKEESKTEETTETPETPKEPVKSKEQAFSTRAFNSKGLNETAKKKLESLGLDYTQESQVQADKTAEKIINEIGIEEAYILAKNNEIRGGVKIAIMAKSFEEMNIKAIEALENGNVEEHIALSDELANLMKYLADEATIKGQENAMLNHIYKNYGIKYDLDFRKTQWRNKFGEDMPLSVEEKLKEYEQKIKQLEEQIKKKEQEIKDNEENNVIRIIKEAKEVNRKKNIKEKSKLLADKLRSLKTKGMTFYDSNGNEIQISQNAIISFNDIVEIGAKIIETTGDILQAVNSMIEELKKQEWYNNLTKIDKESVNKQIKEHISNLDKIEINDIKIPRDLIFNLVESGIDNIEDLTKKVKEYLIDDYPNITDREVRDLITGYGKQISKTKTELEKEVARLKLDGRQISSIEDLMKGNRPKKSGQQREQLTPEQRNRLKKINELLRQLPKDEADTEKYYKNALESYKTRVKRRIDDLTEAINKNEKIIKEKTQTVLDDEAKALKEQRDNLQQEYDTLFGKTELSEETKIRIAENNLQRSINDIEKKIDTLKRTGELEKIPKKKVITSQKIYELNEQKKGLLKELDTLLEETGVADKKRLDNIKKANQRRIDDLKNKLQNKDYSKRQVKKTEYDEELLKLKSEKMKLQTQFDHEFEKQEKAKKGILYKILDSIYDIWNIPKGLKATIDLSAPLRQGIPLLFSNPKIFLEALKEMHKYAGSEKYYDDFMLQLENSNSFILMKESGLSLTDLSGDVLKSEEQFVSKLVTKLPILGIGIKGSERAYSGFLNNLRAGVFMKGVEVLKSQGIEYHTDTKAYKALAKMVNNATGRTNVTSDVELSKFLNAVFFSPKMIMSRFAMIHDIFRHDSTPYVRKQAALNLISFGTYILTTNVLFAIIKDALSDDDDDFKNNFEIDPRSTDFLKMRIGNTRYDISSGFGMIIRTAARVITGETKKVVSDEAKSINEGFNAKKGTGIISDFFRNKVSPSTGFLMSYINKENPSNRFETWDEATKWDMFKSLMMPLGIEQATDAITKDEGFKIKYLIDITLATYGVSVQEYGSNVTQQFDKNTQANKIVNKYKNVSVKYYQGQTINSNKLSKDQQEELKLATSKNVGKLIEENYEFLDSIDNAEELQFRLNEVYEKAKSEARLSVGEKYEYYSKKELYTEKKSIKKKKIFMTEKEMLKKISE